jgi:hypothetical protein
MKMLKLSMPPESDRIIGFTIPRGNSFYICDHDEVWSVDIGQPLRVAVTDNEPYKFVEQSKDFVGLVFSGLSANAPLHKVGESEITYAFDPKSDFVIVNYKVASQRGELKFRTTSGDWFAASFSDDGRYLVLAEPYDIAIYEVV